MFDFNGFKRSVKQWIRENPEGEMNDLRDFCEDQIPPASYTAHSWIIDQTLCWYQHIVAQREHRISYEEDEV